MSERSAAAFLALVFLAAPSAAEPQAPLTLRTAVARALERDPSLLAAARGAEEAAALSRAASSPFRPQFSLTSTPGVTTGLPLSVAGELPAAAGARLRLMLWDASLKADAALASGREAGAEARLSGARQETIRRTAAAYVRLWEAGERLAAAERRLAIRETLASRISARSREGRVTALDADRADLETERARHAVAAARSERWLASADLAAAAGFGDGTEITLAEDPLPALPPVPGGDAGAAALATDPALRALGEEASAATRAASLEDRWFKPQIVAEARYLYVPPYYNYDQYYLKVDTNTAAAAVSFVLPIFSGGLDGARAAAARSREARLREERRSREEEVLRAARAASAEADLSMQEAALAKKSEALARESLRIALALDREGRGDPDGLLRSELEVADARDSAAKAAAAAARSRLSLLARRGELLVLAPPAPAR
jgi:cobalt-zinc-cadmium efflux system outer membrane protein